MNNLLQITGLTKQGFWKQRERSKTNLQVRDQVDQLMKSVRETHKKMSCRKVYAIHAQSLPVGRDIFEKQARSLGYGIKKRRSPIITTWSQTHTIYPNLIEGKILTGINQVWQCDIFYFNCEGTTYYWVTIIDVYSRELLALHPSTSLKAEETLKAFKKALNKRKDTQTAGCIFHTDRGTQFVSKSMAKALNEAGFIPSMCTLPQENAYVERVQGTVQHEYLEQHHITASNMKTMAAKIMSWYNRERPHDGLSNQTPTTFRDKNSKLVESERPTEHIYHWQR
jgi:putative transposase